MTKVKVFYTMRSVQSNVRQDYAVHEEEMNKWLAEHPGVRVIMATMTQTGEQYNTGLMTTIFYEDGASE